MIKVEPVILEHYIHIFLTGIALELIILNWTLFILFLILNNLIFLAGLNITWLRG